MTISSRVVLKILSLTAAFIGMLAVIYLTRTQLVWIGTAFFLAIALNPAVERIIKFMPRHNRLLGTGVVFLMLLAFLSFVVVSLIPPLISQTEQLGQNLPGYSEELIHGDSFISAQIRNFNLVDCVRESQKEIIQYASLAGGSFFSIVKDLFSSFAAGITILVLTFFMLMEGHRWVGIFWRLVPEKRRQHNRELAHKMYVTVTGYVKGNVLTSALAAGLTTIMLVITGVPYAIPLGILVGILDFIPLVGASIGAVVVILAALFTSLGAAFFMGIYFVVYQQFENHLLQPLVYGRTVQMSPLSVLISLLIGAGLGGILGALVAIPVGASLQIVIRDVIDRKLASSTH